MKPNRIGAFVVIALALVLILGQSASVAVKAQVNGSFQAQINQQPKGQQPSDQAPYKITVQGRLTDNSGNPITVATNVSFKLYDAASGGNLLLSEGPISVTPDVRGLLTYQLGSTSVISSALVSAFANPLYLGLTVAGDSEMSPRILLTASPYAMSLAPGAVVSGAYGTDTLLTNFGVINGVNLDRTTVTNAGLYGKGATGVYGEADPSGGFGAYAGYFTNPGGYASSQYGIVAQTSSTGGSDGYAGYFGNSGGGSGNQYGVYARAGASGGHQYNNSVGVVGESTANGISDYTSAGGVFTSTNPYVGSGAVGYGVIGVEGVATAPANLNNSYGGYFSSNVGNGERIGMYASADATTGGSIALGGEFSATGSGNIDAYGVSAGVTGSGNSHVIAVKGYAQGSSSNYGGYFESGTNGIGMFARTDQPGIAGNFTSNDNNATVVRVLGRITATGCCAGANYDIQVRYHGSEVLHAGDILAADGVNETFQGVPTLGVVKANAANADAAIGVAQYPIHKSIKTQEGEDIWKTDPNASAIQPGELATAVVLGQMQVRTSGSKLKVGDKLILDAAGNLALGNKGADNIIGKVVSPADKDGYVTVFVNLKLPPPPSPSPLVGEGWGEGFGRSD